MDTIPRPKLYEECVCVFVQSFNLTSLFVYNRVLCRLRVCTAYVYTRFIYKYIILYTLTRAPRVTVTPFASINKSSRYPASNFPVLGRESFSDHSARDPSPLPPQPKNHRPTADTHAVVRLLPETRGLGITPGVVVCSTVMTRTRSSSRPLADGNKSVVRIVCGGAGERTLRRRRAAVTGNEIQNK